MANLSPLDLRCGNCAHWRSTSSTTSGLCAYFGGSRNREDGFNCHRFKHPLFTVKVNQCGTAAPAGNANPITGSNVRLGTEMPADPRVEVSVNTEKLRKAFEELEREYQLNRATGIEAIVCRDIAERQRKGVAKYGTTVDANPLPLRAWLRHAYEECLDQAVYLRRAMDEIDRQTNA